MKPWHGEDRCAKVVWPKRPLSCSCLAGRQRCSRRKRKRNPSDGGRWERVSSTVFLFHIFTCHRFVFSILFPGDGGLVNQLYIDIHVRVTVHVPPQPPPLFHLSPEWSARQGTDLSSSGASTTWLKQYFLETVCRAYS